MKLEEKFLREIGNCKDPTLFIGVARLLKVRLVEEEKGEDNKYAPKPFETILTELIDKYAAAPRKRKKELYKIFKKANEESASDFIEEEKNLNANRTQNSEASVSN